MTSSLDIWRLLAGLAIFLYGMFTMEDALKAMSGKAFRQMIRQYTRGRLRAIGSGALVTAILQSSSAVSLMVLAFVGAGVMTMENGIGVMMGSNLGTTCTAWIVALFGFKLKIDTFALPLIAAGGLILVAGGSGSRLFQLSRLLMGFGFLFLGLDFIKTGVESFSAQLQVGAIAGYGPWLFLLFGVVATALMQSSSAAIAVALTALNSNLITFPLGVAMVIGANIGTTITVLLGSMGACQAKKRVSLSHLIFNLVTGLIAFIALEPLVWLVSRAINPATNSVMALALFHTLFNLLGILVFLPFVGRLAKMLNRTFPEQKEVLTAYLAKTPTEVVEVAATALQQEIIHLLEECRLYHLKSLQIDERLVFDRELPFQANLTGRLKREELYDKVKLLHGEIFEFYVRLLGEKLADNETKELERLIFASRNIMNAIKNVKGIHHNLSEFKDADNDYLNGQYKLFRRRLMELYHDINRFKELANAQEQYRSLLKAIVHIEQVDKRFIKTTMKGAAAGTIDELEIASLLMVNRLFSQSCRLQVFALKDLLLSQEQIHDFDHTLEMRDLLDEEKAREKGHEEE
ncbi:MAG: Na/Pi symporter [Thermodesulfobacteriota bacterium]